MAQEDTQPSQEGIDLDKADMYIFGQDFPDMEEWLQTVPDERRQQLEEDRNVNAQRLVDYDTFEAKLGQEVPELLEGRLPDEQERRLKEVFGEDVRYIIGSNQTMGLVDSGEAEEYLNDSKGIPMGMYGDAFGSRFLLYDAETVAETPGYGTNCLEGYFGQRIGRFIAVFPLTCPPDEEIPAYYQLLQSGSGVVPQDLFEPDARDGYGREYPEYVVANRYIAGFIDAETQTYLPNAGFLTDKPVDFAN